MSIRNAIKFCLAACAVLWGLPGIGVFIQFFTGGGYPFSVEAAQTLALAGAVPAFCVMVLACALGTL